MIPASLETNDRLRRGLWAGTVLLLLVVAADTQGYTLGGSGLRYVLLVLPLFAVLGAAAASNGLRLDRTTAADRFLAVLVICGLLGSVYGSIFRSTDTPGIVIFLPMCLGLTHLLVREPVTAPEAERYQRALVWVALVFLVLGVLAQTAAWPLGTPTHLAHERAYFVAMGLAAAFLSRRYALTALVVSLVTVMFLQYSAATWLVVAMSVLATGFATSRRGRRSAAVVLIAFAVGVFGFGFAQVQGGQSSFAKDYFTSVGKGDNTNTRSQLWKAAELEINKSPIVGSVFTGNFTVNNVDRVIANRGGSQQIEPHNDYLEILLLGGFFGLFLFAGFIISTNVIVIGRVHRLSDQGAVSQRNLARVLLIGFNAALSVALFNPVLSQLGMCASVFLIYSLMMAVRPIAAVPSGGSRHLQVGSTSSEGRR